MTSFFQGIVGPAVLPRVLAGVQALRCAPTPLRNSGPPGVKKVASLAAPGVFHVFFGQVASESPLPLPRSFPMTPCQSGTGRHIPAWKRVFFRLQIRIAPKYLYMVYLFHRGRVYLFGASETDGPISKGKRSCRDPPQDPSRSRRSCFSSRSAFVRKLLTMFLSVAWAGSAPTARNSGRESNRVQYSLAPGSG